MDWQCLDDKFIMDMFLQILEKLPDKKRKEIYKFDKIDRNNSMQIYRIITL